MRWWADEAQRAASARGLRRPAFQNVMPRFIASLGDAGDRLGHFEGARRELVLEHLSSRLRQGFELAEIIEEFAILGRAIVAVSATVVGERALDGADVGRLHDELQAAAICVSEAFTRHMMHDEQAEKKYLRLLRTIADESLQIDATALRQRLGEVLFLIAESIGADTAALVLADPPLVAATEGPQKEQVERALAALNAEWLHASYESESNTPQELSVGDELARTGLRTLVAVPMPTHHAIHGALIAGSNREGAFPARELRRLEALGEQLAVHLATAKLYAEQREHIDRLRDERELRDRFVSVLAHDLRGPLSAAKSSVQLLQRATAADDERRRQLAAMVERNIDRTDRMVRDLLDANRIRAGERLSVVLAPCDLVAIAREVVDELSITLGPRLHLDTDERVVGWWGGDELRRVIWNLATNAAKYGADDGVITVAVKNSETGGVLSVHNWGKPISAEDQRLLFRPFSRTATAGVQKGWGLGLTLVQGTAEALGGRVTVESTADGGTTFRLELPRDSRRTSGRA